MGEVPGPVDPFLKTLQGYSLFIDNFSDQSLFYTFRDIDTNYEFCLFQKDIFSFRLKDSLLGPFPITLTSIVALFLHIFSFQKVFIVFAILNLILAWIIFQKINKSFVMAFLVFFGLPFFIPNSEVSEHALLIFTEILGYSLLEKAIYTKRHISYNQNLYLFLAGISFGAGVFLRHEVILFANFLVGFMLFLKLFFKGKSDYTWRALFFLTLGVYISFFLFFIMNKMMYGTSVGPRLNTNSNGLYADFTSKFIFFKSILWKEGPNLGLFGKNPQFLFSLCVSFIFYRKWNLLDKLFLFPTLGMILFVPILAPNDGGSPWGARYIFLTIFPLVCLTSRVLHWIDFQKRPKVSFAIKLILILTLIHGLNVEKKALFATKAVASQQNKYIEETAIKDADLIVFTSELVAMQTGINYIEFPVVLLNQEENFPSFRSKFLSKKDKFKRIVVVEAKLENLNLSSFSGSDLRGIKADGIIKEFDNFLIKQSMKNLELTRIHRYLNK